MSDFSKWNGLPLVIFGTEGCALDTKLVVDGINQHNKVPVFSFLGFVSEHENLVGSTIDGAKVVACEESFATFTKGFLQLGVAIGIANPHIKQKISQRLKQHNHLVFPNLVHPLANLGNNCQMGIGNVICSGVFASSNVVFGNFGFVYANTTIGHDVTVGNCCSILALCAISGHVSISDLVLVGSGSSIKQNLMVENGATIGLGATVVNSVLQNQVMIGNKATLMQKNSEVN